nr:villin-2 isoform X4 [Arachis hypogaea]
MTWELYACMSILKNLKALSMMLYEDQRMASRLANTMFSSLKGRPVQGRIFEGKEPPQFVALFQPMVVLKGGLSSGYKKLVADKGLQDETYTAESVALIRISRTAIHNNNAVQVDAVAASLNSAECFVLQSGSTMFTWHGNQSSFEQQQLAAKVVEFLKPGVALKHAKEGTGSSAFWFALGGKQSYTSFLSMKFNQKQVLLTRGCRIMMKHLSILYMVSFLLLLVVNLIIIFR